MPSFAFLGKGGSGKSTLAGTTARVLARRGHRVLALDADHVPGLASALGVAVEDTHMLAEAASIDDDGRITVTGDLTDAVERLSRTGPDGVRFLQSGKSSGPQTREQRASATVFRALVEAEPGDRTVVIDLSAGTRQAYFGWAGVADTLVTVVIPSQKAVMTARRLVPLVEALADRRHLIVLNDVADPHEAEVARVALERCGLDVALEVPRDQHVRDAAMSGLALVDHAPTSPFVSAVDALVDLLLDGAAAHTTAGSVDVPGGGRP